MKNVYCTKSNLPPTIPPQTPPHLNPPSTHPTTPHEFFGAYFIQIPSWVTQCFPGWAKWGFKEYWNVSFSHVTKVCWDSQTLAQIGPFQPNALSLWSCTIERAYFEPTLQLLCYKLFLKVRHHAPEAHRPRSFQIWIWRPKKWPTPTVLGCPAT